MEERESKQFLVKFGAEIRRTFADPRRVKEGSRLVIQIRVDDSVWAGEFVDLIKDQLRTVPNKRVLQVVPEVGMQPWIVICCSMHFILYC